MGTKYIFIIGETQVGKTTLANEFIKDYFLDYNSLYEAGKWVRNIFTEIYGGVNEKSVIDRNILNNIAIEELEKNPNISIDTFKVWNENNSSNIKVLVGFRNPKDILGIIDDLGNDITVYWLKGSKGYDELITGGIEEIIKIFKYKKIRIWAQV